VIELLAAQAGKTIVIAACATRTQPHHCDGHCDKARHLIENFLTMPKQYRCIATCHTKTARNSLGLFILSAL
jgi:hypothetical protein